MGMKTSDAEKRGRCSEPDLLLRTFAISIWIIFPDFVLGQCSASECSISGNCFFPEKGLSSVFGSGSCAPCFMGGTSEMLLFDKQTHREFLFTITNLKKNSRFHCNTFRARAPRKLTDTEERILGRINKRRELVSLEKPGQDFSSGEWNIPNIRFLKNGTHLMWNVLAASRRSSLNEVGYIVPKVASSKIFGTYLTNFEIPLWCKSASCRGGM
ncbi:hypothetical protein CEXT_166591 [Caerostris extrusa]|uniref:Uncharacterized protein n=1 Tax=Caerostris extrusa TaxID=172846 RepID=A0AAV4T568_CAEEX|nr:hypothetical protein CEXT_166591 [Caerostris extrusa]